MLDKSHHDKKQDQTKDQTKQRSEKLTSYESKAFLFSGKSVDLWDFVKFAPVSVEQTKALCLMKCLVNKVLL